MRVQNQIKGRGNEKKETNAEWNRGIKRRSPSPDFFAYLSAESFDFEIQQCVNSTTRRVNEMNQQRTSGSRAEGRARLLRDLSKDIERKRTEYLVSVSLWSRIRLR